MAVRYDVPFYANPDETHCVQATLKMVLKYFLDKDFSFEELDALSRKSPGKGTWLFPALINIEKMGVQIKNIEPFDYQKYFEQGDAYVTNAYPPLQARYYIEESNLSDVKDAIPLFLKTIRSEMREASMRDIEKLLEEEWLVTCEVNANCLQEEKGFEGHMVLVVGFDDKNFYLNDSDESRNRKEVPKEKFEKCWSDSGFNLTAFRV